MSLTAMFVISILFQVIATILAFRLIYLSGRWVAWSFISAALMLMVVRRCVPFYHWWTNELTYMPDILNEYIGLLLSLVMVIGIVKIIPVFVERKREEEALKASEERFRILFENSPISIWEEDLSAVKSRLDDLKTTGVGDLDSYLKHHPEVVHQCAELIRITNLNHAAMLLHEADNKDELCRELQRTFTPESYIALQQLLVAIGNGIKATACDAVIKTLSGNLRQVIIYFNVCPGYENTLSKVLVSIIDITERKQAEKALHEREADLQLALEATKMGVWSWNIITGEIEWSPQCKALYGISPETTMSYERFLAAVHPEDRMRVDAALKHAVMNRADYEVEKRVVWADGSVHWNNSRGRVFCNDAGEPIRMTGVTFDITERKRADEALSISEEKFRSIAEQLTDMIFVTDRLGNIHYVSPVSERLFGCHPEQMLGRHFREFLEESEQDKAIAAFDKNLAENHSIKQLMLRMKRIDGSSFMGELDATQSHFGEETGTLGVIRDCTDRLSMEEQLRQSQKMESVGRLAGGVAHDFNNMLGVIIGYTELALMRTEPTDPLFADLHEILKAAHRSADLTRQLLAFARKQVISPKVLDLNDTVAGMLKMLQRLIGEEIRLNWNPGSDLWHVKIDPSQIDQILANLAVNARDAITGVGAITLETKNVVLDDAYCSVYSETIPGEYVMMAMSDTGMGMEKEVLEHLFEPFFTTKGVGKGTGLGLATIYGIVKQNQGTIHVYSEPNFGTTIKIYLPRFQTDAVAVSEEKKTFLQLEGTETILLVEDEKEILELGKTILERMGYTVLAAPTPNQAIQHMKEYSGKVHMVITDVVMPEMNGRELLKQLHAFQPDLKYLFMSGYTANIIAHHGILDEDVQFIQKPFTVTNLAEKVRQVLDYS